LIGFWENRDKNITSRFFARWFVLCIVILICLLLYPDRANSGPYLDSAHGNNQGSDTGYGVKRNATGFPSDYARGNCAHCHEQHASIGGSEPAPTGGPDKYELFRSLFVDQSSMFCYACHSDSTESLQSPTFNNYLYSRTRGGASTSCPSDIKTAFQYEDTSGNSNSTNPCSSITTYGSSAHTLSTVQSYLAGKTTWGFSSTTENNNPCSACHDPHRAQKDYPCSRPNTHSPVSSWELWGDDDNTTERFSVASKGPPPATSGYMSPYKVGGGYEEDTFPAGTNRTTKFSRICRDCHDSSPPSGLADVNWSSAYHGLTGSSNIQYGGLVAPYSTANSTDYELNCTDCHEPHGSRNEYLLRSTVNGVTNITIADSSGNYQTGRWYNFCTACHTYNSTIGPHNVVSQGVSNVQDMDCTFGSCHGHGGLHF
jgi:hypothetical protein